MNTELLHRLTALRRQLHQQPELGFRETQTAALVSKALKAQDIPYQSNIAITGLVGLIDKGPGPCIALRADMDALPIQEDTGLEFSSQKPGLMHACGHDLHTVILLGAAALLKDQDFQGRVKLIFQPSEEGTYPEFTADGTCRSGGERMVAAGILDDVDAALGLHVHPLLPVGTVAYCPGQALAATGFFKIEIKGKAGHAAFPEQTIDPVLVSSQVISAAQNIVSRYSSPTQPTVISFTRIEGGVNENIIPDVVNIWGTIRALDKATYDSCVTRLKEVLQGLELISRAQISLNFTLNYPSLLNDERVHQALTPTLTEIFSADRIQTVAPLMGGEDFAFMSRAKPSAFYFLGARQDDSPYFLHHPKVLFNEACIPYGSKLLAHAALELIRQGAKFDAGHHG